ncbi:MAG: hypothetical protein QNJ09_14050 [Paracoccaceae bacterium]|nr:hypothetical protein [Paracoccaceae bacterium]
MSRWIIPLAALTAALYAVMAWEVYYILKPAAEGLAPFDMRPMGYTVADVYDYLSRISERGRAVYLVEMRLLGWVFPLLLALLMAAVLWHLARSWHVWSRMLLLMPIAGYMVMDLCENALVGELLRSGADEFDPRTAMLASEFTVTKSALIVVSVILLVGFWARGFRHPDPA